MSGPVRPGPAATPADRAAARHGRLLLHGESERVREAALAWRNGLGALLAGLVGFGLLKGRTDVAALAAPYAALVGGLLLGALGCGTVSAVLLLRAAHGRPAVSALPVREPGRPDPGPVAAGHVEALRAARSLTWGVVATLACTALLTAAVALTWYGPSREGPRLTVTTPAGTYCGEPLGAGAGRLRLRTAGGELSLDLATAVALHPVPACPAPSP
ncbi:hypothetical protein [Streptomyces sp. NPDC097619]|uniref:hypothetical protein n=1 Tax=Streptomyces sp. NPDC097619 TaxID=3157228 RepID=UPI00331B2876